RTGGWWWLAPWRSCESTPHRGTSRWKTSSSSSPVGSRRRSSVSSSGSEPILREAGIGIILLPKWRSVLARLTRDRQGAGVRLLLLLVIGGIFWTAAFGIFYRVLRYLGGTQAIGTLLAGQVLRMTPL